MSLKKYRKSSFTPLPQTALWKSSAYYAGVEA